MPSRTTRGSRPLAVLTNAICARRPPPPPAPRRLHDPHLRPTPAPAHPAAARPAAGRKASGRPAARAAPTTRAAAPATTATAAAASAENSPHRVALRLGHPLHARAE